VNGARDVYDIVQDELEITYDETTNDGNFSLLSVACLGCCSLAPVMTINGETHGRLDSNKVRKVVRDEKRRAGAASKATEG
jgi:NADH-quinone oxidoreductase subunit E